jgi:heme/copper-type cytochrome/quinol oxidase subunit 4
MNALKMILFALAVVSSFACMVLLFRGYLQKRVRLLMWGALCFVGLTINNIMMFTDLIIFPQGDLRLFRLIPALAGAACMVYALIWEPDRNGG